MKRYLAGLTFAATALTTVVGCGPPQPDVSVVTSHEDCRNIATGVHVIDHTELGQLLGTSIISVDQPTEVSLIAIAVGPRPAGQRVGVISVERIDGALNITVGFELPAGGERDATQQPCLVLAVGEPDVGRITVRSDAGPIGVLDLSGF